MTMQISTSSLFSIPRNAILDLQSQIAKAETEVTSGQLADPAQSLGSQLGLDETLQAQSANLTNLQSSNTIAQSTLSASQNALTQIASDAQSFVNAIMPPKVYQIKIHGAVVASSELRIGEILVVTGDGPIPNVPGEETREPAFGMLTFGSLTLPA